MSSGNFDSCWYVKRGDLLLTCWKQIQIRGRSLQRGPEVELGHSMKKVVWLKILWIDGLTTFTMHSWRSSHSTTSHRIFTHTTFFMESTSSTSGPLFEVTPPRIWICFQHVNSRSLALRIKQLSKLPDDITKLPTNSTITTTEQGTFEWRYQRRLWRGEYQPGEFVLIRNSRVEKELDRKTKPRYLGPFEIVRCTQGGSYILKEMDGTISRRGVAAFRLLPYQHTGRSTTPNRWITTWRSSMTTWSPDWDSQIFSTGWISRINLARNNVNFRLHIYPHI